jgi:hypothetical protein
MKQLIITTVIFLGLAAYAHANLLKNSQFDQGLSYWVESGGDFSGSVEKESAENFLRILSERERVWNSYSQDLTLPSYDGIFLFSAELRSAVFTGGLGPYLALEYLDEKGQRIAVDQAEFIEADGEWHETKLYVQIPEKTSVVRFSMLLNGSGKADFRNPVLAQMDSTENRLEAPAAPIAIKVSGQPNPIPFVGFGAQDNGWAYASGNLAFGWTDRELVQREERIRFLSPSFVRTFVWIGEWLPENFFRREFTDQDYLWDSDLMQGKYRALQLYKDMGVPVNITGVEWEMERFGSLWENKEKTLQAYADLMEHLIKTKGFTNIQYFTLSNEPNTAFIREQGGTFELYSWFSIELDKEFRKRGLDVEIVASDDAEGFDWFTFSVKDEASYAVSGIVATHHYLKFPEWNKHEQTQFLQSRTALLDSLPERKPLLVTEFGFHTTGWSNMDNPYMREYPYAIHLADYAIEGFNLGVSGFCVWTIHEAYYPPYGRADDKVHTGNRIMGYGLWNYYDDELRPGYYATALFARHTEEGQPIYATTSSHETIVRATVIGDNLFFVNKAVNEATIQIQGRLTGSGYGFTQGTVDQQQLMDGDVLKKDRSANFVLPPRSFGRIALQ